MKSKHLFFKLNRCTGCQLCVMACSLGRAGVCGEKEANITVLTHPRFGTSQPLLFDTCLEETCQGECLDVCTPGVLALVSDSEIAKLMADPQWNPVPIIPERGLR